MNRTLLLLNALALAVLLALILQPQGAVATSPAGTAPAMAPQLTEFDTATETLPASIQPPRLQPTAEQRLIF
ncbi:hypothetical protein GPJ81_19235 [Pseudomonas alkylphenolica]|jgi:hypothetical protein|uniref:Uncharacterized protein n=1 Tax=Pseudomonas alkylphenolica TaxID=237609 RepID=A0A6I6HC19_9PSED|nr:MULTISPECIES: hypothetical protein [Pseudomonas]QGW78728.1 hypothetical protein GPJ81_19235 [Pseudomonas alkylphenolica]